MYKLKLFIVSIFLCTVAYISSSVTSFAQPDTSGGIQLSPTSHRVTAVKNSSQIIEFTIKNVNDKPTKVSYKLLDFEPDLQGYPKFFPDNKVSAYTLRHNLTLPEPVVLQSNETKAISVSYGSDNTQLPGVYYGALVFSTSDVTDVSSESISGVAGTIVVEVPGVLRESAELISFGLGSATDGGAIQLRSISWSPYTKARLVVRNSGETLIEPYGKLIIKKSDGEEVGTYEINTTDPQPQAILPGTDRELIVDINRPINKAGVYDAEIAFGFDSTGQYIYRSTKVYFVPKVAVVALVSFITIALLIGARIHTTKSGKHLDQEHEQTSEQ